MAWAELNALVRAALSGPLQPAESYIRIVPNPPKIAALSGECGLLCMRCGDTMDQLLFEHDNLIVNGYEDNQQAIIVGEERAEQGLTAAL